MCCFVTEDVSRKSSALHDFEKLYSQAMQLQVQVSEKTRGCQFIRGWRGWDVVTEDVSALHNFQKPYS